ncbi:hypothetical protein [Streptomyces sp. NPDC050560]|uniref:hypothetical protein n=1 Tax=Streptomyces sp. NPDC050560 TaxID=3365630 RepID=UPI0037A62DF1
MPEDGAGAEAGGVAGGGPPDGLGYVPEVLTPAEAVSRTRAVSSEILDMIGIRRGKVTEPGPGIVPHEADPERLFTTLHPWSVYDVPDDALERGFLRLAELLPRRHWRITDRGPTGSPARNPELTADHERARFAVNAELRLPGPLVPDQPPLILVNVVSGVLRTADGHPLAPEATPGP